MKIISMILCILIVVCVASSNLFGASWSYDFGTGADATYSTASGVSTTFLPQPSSNGGEDRVRIGSTGGQFKMQATTIGYGGRELEAKAPTTTSVNKFSIYDYSPAANVFYIKYKMRLTGGAVGTWSLFIGDGAQYSDNTSFAGAQTFTGIRWIFGASGAITEEYRNGSSWTGISGNPFSQDTTYTVEIFGNNSSASKTYSKGGSQTVAAYKWDLWVNDTLVGDDLAKALLPDSGNVDSFMFYGESSAANVATIKLDDFSYANEFINEPALSASAVSPVQIDLTIGPNANNNNVVVVWNSSGTFTTPYGAPPSLGQSFAGGTLLVNGIGTSYNHTSLTSGTRYYYKAWSYDGAIYSSAGVTADATTPKIYYSQGSVAPNTMASWNTVRGGSGSSPANFTSGDTFIIQNGHAMATSANWTISGSSAKLQIESSGTLTANNAVSATSFQIDSGGTLNSGNNIISGAGAFTLSSGATLGIGSADGITASAASGNIQVTGARAFDTGANYTYNGSGAQVTGNGLPSTVNILKVNNTVGLSFSQSVTPNVLNGNGRIASAVTIASGKTMKPGNSIGTIATGDLTFESGGIIEWEYDNTSADLIDAGALVFGNPATVKIIKLGTVVNGEYTLANFTGSDPTLGNLAFDLSGALGVTSVEPYITGTTAKSIKLVLLPEPGVLALAGLLLVALRKKLKR